MSKQILITGSTDGIGKLAAIQLARAGYTIYLHGRNAQKLEVALREVKAQTASASVHGFLADFSNLAAVRNMATEVKKQIPALDVIINNAGVFNSPNAINQDGQDIRLVVNYLAPYLLTKMLLPLLAQKENARLINVGSAAQAPVDLSVLQNGQALSEQSAYAQSKLALTMWTFHMAKTNPGLTSIVVNPGSLLDTKMAKEAFGQVWATADKGATILAELATEERYHDASGQYFDNDKGGFGPAHPEAYDQAKTEALIDQTEQLIN